MWLAEKPMQKPTIVSFIISISTVHASSEMALVRLARASGQTMTDSPTDIPIFSSGGSICPPKNGAKKMTGMVRAKIRPNSTISRLVLNWSPMAWSSSCTVQTP